MPRIYYEHGCEQDGMVLRLAAFAQAGGRTYVAERRATRMELADTIVPRQIVAHLYRSARRELRQATAGYVENVSLR